MKTTRLLTAMALATTFVTRVAALDLRLTTENDFLTNNPTSDDLYTFGLAFEFEQGPYTVSLRENAFTDRAAGARFDETYLTVRRAVPGLAVWSVEPEAGFVHVGHGLFGQSVQNGFHRLIGDEPVELAYESGSLHLSLGLDAERPFRVARTYSVGPRIELDVAPGFRSGFVVGGQSSWRPARSLEVETLLGAHASHASLALLEPHLAALAPIARVAAVVGGGFTLSWSYNDYGDRREHLSVGYRVQLGARDRQAPAPMSR